MPKLARRYVVEYIALICTLGKKKENSKTGEIVWYSGLCSCPVLYVFNVFRPVLPGLVQQSQNVLPIIRQAHFF